MLAGGDEQHRSKQMTQPSKNKQWMEITDAVTWWQSRALSSWFKRSTQDATHQVEHICQFYYLKILCSLLQVSQLRYFSSC